MTEEPTLCEMCGQNPVRRADQEYREVHPDDPWMMLCEACDKQTGGATPPRKNFKREVMAEEFGPRGAALRLEYLKFETRLETAVYARLSRRGHTIPKQFAWLKALPEKSVDLLNKEIVTIKDQHGSYMYSPRGFGLIEEGLRKYRTLCGTYQLMSGVGVFTGIKPEQVIAIEA